MSDDPAERAAERVANRHFLEDLHEWSAPSESTAQEASFEQEDLGLRPKDLDRLWEVLKWAGKTIAEGVVYDAAKNAWEYIAPDGEGVPVEPKTEYDSVNNRIYYRWPDGSVTPAPPQRR